MFIFWLKQYDCTIKNTQSSEFEIGNLENLMWWANHVYYAPLMMSHKKSPTGASWVIPRMVDKMVWVSAQFSTKENNDYFLLLDRAGQVTTDWEKKTMGDSWLYSRNHPGITHHFLLPNSSISVLSMELPIINYKESGTHTKLATFLGSTHGWFMGDSFCDIINF